MTFPPVGPSRRHDCAPEGAAARKAKTSNASAARRSNGESGEVFRIKKAGLEKFPPSPLMIFVNEDATLSTNCTVRERSSSGLVGCALRHDDEVNATVCSGLVLLLRRFASACGDAGFVYALLDNVLLSEIGAGLSELGRLRFLTVGVAHDNQLSVRIVLQAESHVVADALASIVKARCTDFVVAAIAGLGCLRRRRRLLDVNGGRTVGGAALAVAYRAFYGVTAGCEASR